ncbi:Gfo/Idh/MocA family protein [Candidatus Hydrogenedentota bacterium]
MSEIRIGVIGASGRAQMAKHWHDPKGRSVVAGAADICENALDWFRENINEKAFVTNDHRELLDRNDIDAIAVMTPDDSHEQLVCDAFEAGKHVFCEKPMAITTGGCDRTLRAWVDSGKKFMIGFNMRYMNIFRVMKDAIDSGAIGEVKVVWVRHFVGTGSEWYFHDWHGASRYSNGLLLQKASHDIDMIHWLTGRYGTRVAGFGGLDYYGGDKPDSLRCPDCAEKDTCVEFHHDEKASENKKDQCVFRNEIDVEDNSAIMFELEGGIKATYMQCHFAPDYWRNYTLIGTEGRIENLDDDSKVVVRMRDRSNRWKNLSDGNLDVKPAKGGHGGADPEICKDFVDMLINGREPLATPLAGRMSVAIGCAATQSVRNNWQPVDVSPVPEDIREQVF